MKPRENLTSELLCSVRSEEEAGGIDCQTLRKPKSKEEAPGVELPDSKHTGRSFKDARHAEQVCNTQNSAYPKPWKRPQCQVDSICDRRVS